jgi:hypothetical protein
LSAHQVETISSGEHSGCGPVGEVEAHQFRDHDEGVTGIWWPLKEPSILPLGDFFQTSQEFISETFGAWRRLSFCLPREMEVGREKGKCQAEGGSGGKEPAGCVETEK